MKHILLSSTFSLALMATTPAFGFKEIEVQERYCAGMQINQQLPDGSEVDCAKGDLAIEVDFSDHWAQAIGQSLHYGQVLQTRPAIILVCNAGVRTATCDRHYARLVDTLNYWRIGMLIWFCRSEQDATLSDCKFADLYEAGGME